MRPGRLRVIAVAAGYFAAACAFTWPMIGRMSLGVWGRSWDAINNLWFFDFVRRDIIGMGEWSATTTKVFYPVGYDLRADLAHFLLPLASAPLQNFMSLTATYNLLLLLSLTFSGIAAYFLARRFTQNAAAAFAAGILWIANPVAVREIASGSLEVACSGFFVLAFIALLRLRESATIWRAAQLAGAWFCAGLTNWVMAGMFGLALVFAWPFLVYRKGKGLNKKLAALIAAALIGVTVLSLPFIGPLIQGDKTSINEADASLAAIAPDKSFSRQIGGAGESPMMALAPDSLDAGDLFVAQDASDPAAPLVWWLIFIPALLSLLVSERRKTWLVGGGFMFMILALGPFLRWFDQFRFGGSLSIPLPAWVAYKIVPGFHLFYRPYRFMFPAVLLLIGPAAAYWETLVGQGRTKKARGVLSACVISACFVAGLAGFQGAGGAFNRLHVPDEYRTVMKPLKARALIDAPFFPLPVSNVNAHAMFAQTRHGIPILNATHLRLDGWRRFADFIEGNSCARAMLDLQLKKPGPYRVEVDDARKLGELGFDLVLAHTSYSEDDPSVDRFRRMPHEFFILLERLFGEPDELVMGLVYKTDKVTKDETVIMQDTAAKRLRFARQYFQPSNTREAVGYVTLETNLQGFSETLPFSLPEGAGAGDDFCGWFRFNASLNTSRKVWLESGAGDAGRGDAWKISFMIDRMDRPFQSRPMWRRYCRKSEDWLPENTAAPFDPSRLSWLRLRHEGGDPITLEMDDLAFVPRVSTADNPTE